MKEDPKALLARRERLESERNELLNSFGAGIWRDGLIVARIKQIDREMGDANQR
jgi:hypothetical protein